MRPSLDQVAQQGARLLPAPLGRVDWREPLPAIGPVFGWSGLEVRLTGSGQVDLMSCIDPGGPHSLPPQVDGPGRWAAFAALYRAWRADPEGTERIPYLWIEQDLPTDGPAGAPIVFAKLGPHLGAPGGVQLAAMLELLGLGQHAPDLTALTASLPTSARLVHIADLGVRGVEALRLIVSAPIDRALGFLQRYRWPGTADELDRVLDLGGRYASHTNLSIDWHDGRIAPRLGIEVLYPGSTSTDPRWQQTFTRLVQHGLATPRQIDALHTWGTRPSRQLQLKLTTEHGQIRAKAYLAFHPDQGR